MFSAPTNAMSMFTSGPQYSIRNFTHPTPTSNTTGMRAYFRQQPAAAAAPTRNNTGMRAYFQRQAAATTSSDPAVIRAAAMEKATEGPLPSGGKRYRKSRRGSRKTSTRRRKNRSYRRKN